MTLPLPSDGSYGLGLLLGGSLKVLWQQRRAFLRAAALPLALAMLQVLVDGRAPLQGEGADDDLAGDLAAGADPELAPPWPVTLLLALWNLFAIAIFSVAWYRLLLGYGLPRLWPGLHQAQLRFLGRMLLLLLLPLAPLLLLGGAIPHPLLAVAVLALVYLSVRWSLVLPAAAVDVRLSFRQSWRATAGKAWPLFLAPLLGAVAIAFLVALPFLLLAGFVVDANEAEPGPLASFVLWLEFELLVLLAVAQAAAVLAIAAVRLAPDPQRV